MSTPASSETQVTPAAAEPVRWSRRRWVYTSLAVFALQLGLVLLLGRRPQPQPQPPTSGTRIVPLPDTHGLPPAGNPALLQDPTLFVLPQLQAFSGRAWLFYPPPQHQLSDWTEPPQWLGFNAEQMGEQFAWYAQTATNRPLRVADLPLPPLPGSDLPVPNQPVAQELRFAIEGDLRSRPLTHTPTLQSWTHPEPLSNTVVHVAVDAQGWPVATTLLAPSGLPAADEFALQQTTAARFEPLRRPQGAPAPDESLTWGRIVFHWHTLPPGNTNAAAP